MIHTFIATIAMLFYIILIGIEMRHVLEPLSLMDKLKVSVAIGIPSAVSLILFIILVARGEAV